MPLRGTVDVTILAEPTEPVLDAVVVHEHVHLLAGARGSEAAGMRHSRREGGDEHGDDRDGGGGASEAHASVTLASDRCGSAGSRVKMP